MRSESENVLLLGGFIYDPPTADQEKVEECIKEIRAIMEKYGEHATPAIALIGAELSE